MEELIPVGAGVVLGLVATRLGLGRGVRLVAAGLLVGGAAAGVTGELLVSPVYVLVDAGQVLLAALLTARLAARWRSRTPALEEGA